VFKVARIKLTAWYLLIIVVISGVFSLFVYSNLTLELERRVVIFRPRWVDIGFSQQILDELKSKIALRLLTADLIIWIGSGVGGYFLAGLTLKPIEKMMDDQKRFVSDASHELRTPLTALKTELEVALRSKKIDQKTTRELLKSNLEEVDKMQKLSNYLLALNKYQNGKIKFPAENIQLTDVIKKAIEKTKTAANKKKITIEANLKEMMINGNKVNFEELFIIFLDNAIKYSHKGGKVIVSTVGSKNWVKITIKDFGVGIAETDLPHIFDRFYRAETSRNKIATDGFGLGLAIADNIVSQYGGKIEVKSKENEGSAFTILIPTKL